MSLPIITVSACKSFRRCQREYQFRYERGIMPAGERAATLRYGQLIHTALEAWWLNPADRLPAALQAIAAAECEPFERAKAEVMLTGYDARWSGEDLETLAVETEFECPVINPSTGAPSRTWRLAGKIDGIVRSPDGRVWVLEHKTSSEDVSAGSLYWQKLRLDAQVSTYFVGARSLGFDVSGCIYDVLCKPAIRPGLATPTESRKYTKDGRLYAAQRAEDETPEQFKARLIEAVAAEPDRYFARGEVVRLETEELDAASDMWGVTRLVRESQLTGRWPRNPDACERYGRLCDYWPICSGEASADDATRFRAEQIHVELTERNAA